MMAAATTVFKQPENRSTPATNSLPAACQVCGMGPCNWLGPRNHTVTQSSSQCTDKHVLAQGQ